MLAAIWALAVITQSPTPRKRLAVVAGVLLGLSGLSKGPVSYYTCLFVFISHLDDRFSNHESLDYLRTLAGQNLGVYHKRVVFMHIPRWVSPDIKERRTADEAELMRS